MENKTAREKIEDALQGDSEPAQPMLRGVNIAKCFLDVIPSICVREDCLPWDHEDVECFRFRQSRVGSR